MPPNPPPDPVVLRAHATDAQCASFDARHGARALETGDADGVMIIPRHLADEIAVETVEMELFEAFVLEEVNAGASIRGLYPPTDPATLTRFTAWKDN